jgi:predicted DNA-binding transcriptional regulator AlpA
MPIKQPISKDRWTDRVAAVPGVGFDPVLGSDESSEYCGYSLSHWRALVHKGRVPQPIRISDRKLGWRLSTLNEWLRALEIEQGVRPPSAA